LHESGLRQKTGELRELTVGGRKNNMHVHGRKLEKWNMDHTGKLRPLLFQQEPNGRDKRKEKGSGANIDGE